MMVKFNKKILIAFVSLWFTNAITSKANAQENRTEYYSFGINLSSDFLSTENEKNAVDYEYKDIMTFNFGLNYKITKPKYNILFSLQLRNYNLTNKSNFKGEDIPDPLGYKSETILYGFSQLKLNSTFNLYITQKAKLNTYLGIGPEILFYPEDPISGLLFFIDEDGTEIGYTENGNSKESEFYFGINGTIGMEFKTKHVLINPYILYHYEPGSLFESTTTTQNLYVSENTVSKHSINNSYWSFGINFYPSKNLFKRKNSKP
ncbi:hypothetical protein [Flavobacterium helocola]|uniref:Outer membrane protein beta-barrel domain-containing protein n=1 Tax=Flavobacterium helocola TaxID=3139139 RepID=A0ABU9I273_9FLAO